MSIKKMLLGALLAFGLVASLITGVSAQGAIRYPIPGSDFPISLAVEIPADATLVYLSGQVPSVTDETAEPSTIAAFGGTEAQTVNVLEKIEGILTDLDLTMSDVVKMQAFLV
ncbi:MAG: Rid family hydrolase, partial [Phormidesmis sp.]